MVLSECGVSLFTAFFTLLKLSWDNIGWLLLLLIILGIMSTNKLLFSGFLELVAIVDDATSQLTLAGGASSGGLLLGILGVITELAIGVTLAFVLGIGWAILILMSNANILLKALAAPVYFFLGVAWGFFPYSIPGTTTTLTYATRGGDMYGVNLNWLPNVLCAVPVLLFVLSFLVFGNWLCTFVQYLNLFLI
jgi:hypothetical protein